LQQIAISDLGQEHNDKFLGQGLSLLHSSGRDGKSRLDQRAFATRNTGNLAGVVALEHVRMVAL